LRTYQDPGINIAMTVQVLGCRMKHDVGAVIERARGDR
jgi:hypothetical protein